VDRHRPDLREVRGQEPRLAPVGRFTSEVVNDLASETVARAYANFRDYVLPKGIWNPAKGASLTTFFIGQCLFRYPNVLRRHIRQVRRDRPLRPAGTVDELEDGQLVDRRSAGTDANAIGKITAVEQLEKFDPTTRAIIAFRSEGYSWDEVAELVGLSVPAAKSRLFRVPQPGEAS
jgi:DNA-directed RNA polymerase specialized sigma24 family protein